MRKEDKRLSNRIDPTTVLRPSDLLNLPDAPDFISKPPEYTAGEMVKLCEAMLPHWNRIRYANPRPPFTGEPFRFHDEDKASGD